MTQIQAIFCALAGFFGWVLVDVAVKLAAQSGLTPFVIVGVFGLISFIGLIGIAIIKRDWDSLRPLHWRQQIIVALCSLTCWYANTIALRHLPLTVFYPLVFTAPLVIMAATLFLKHEAWSSTKIACVVAGFLGVVLAVAPRGIEGGEGIGYLACVFCVTAFALYTLTIRKISQTDSIASIQFVTSVIMVCVGLLGFAFGGPMPTLPDASIIAIFIAGGFINLVSNFFFNKALKHTSSTNVAQLHYTQIIWGAIIGFFIWHEIPTWNLWVGSAAIIASGLVVAAQAHKNT